MAIIFISLKMLLMACSKILNFASRIFIEGMCDVALALAVITISVPTFQPLFVMFSNKRLVFFQFCSYGL